MVPERNATDIAKGENLPQTRLVEPAGAKRSTLGIWGQNELG